MTPRITSHALKQYMARRPGPPVDGLAAKAELEALVARAHLVGPRTGSGGSYDLWRVGGTKRSQDRWRFRVVAGSVVTVLPPCEAMRRGREAGR